MGRTKTQVKAKRKEAGKSKTKCNKGKFTGESEKMRVRENISCSKSCWRREPTQSEAIMKARQKASNENRKKSVKASKCWPDQSWFAPLQLF